MCIRDRQYTYHQTDWVADVCAHQFHPEYERARLMRLPCRLVGHANQKMIHEVYLRLKEMCIRDRLISGCNRLFWPFLWSGIWITIFLN